MAAHEQTHAPPLDAPPPDVHAVDAVRARAGAPVAARIAPLLAGFVVTSMCIVAAVGWSRQQPRAASAPVDEPASAQEPVASEPESSWADGAVPTGISLNLAADEARYAVTGTTASEIFTSIDRNAPSTAKGKAAGLTHMQGRSYDYVRDPATGKCRITRVHALITVTLPDLQSAFTMPEQIIESWRAYERGVDRHERQHVAIYQAGAERAVRELERLQPFADKHAMERAFEATWLAEMSAADVENDAFHRREVEGTRMEREVLTNELARLERELQTVAGRVEELERAHPDLRMPADDARRYNEAGQRLRALQTERLRVAEELAWMR
jgi:predicted secreted Zn-dependent protease